MHEQVIKIGPPDYVLLFMVLLLVGFGFIMVLSASPSVGYEYFGDGYYFIKKHSLYVLLGIVAFLLGISVDYNEYKRFSLLAVLGVILLLILTLIPGLGKVAGGARRWLNLGFILFQPSELAKIVVVIFLASAFEKKKEKIANFWSGIFPLLTVVGVISLLILKQPDLGTSVMILSLSMILLFAGGAKIIHWLCIIILGFIGTFLVILNNPYQIQRIFAFLNPWKDPLGINFHVIQSWIAVGSGGFLGLGLGNSKLKYSYLPQQYTDFVFAILCEEGGLIIAVFIVSILLLFMYRCFRLVFRLQNSYDKYLALGMGLYIVLQALLNLLVVLGLIPATGIPFPFISFGGTSLIVSFFACGVLANISRRV